MPEIAKVMTTDAEIDAAIEQARRFEKYDRRAVRASYSALTDRISLRLENSVTYNIPRRLLQGLSDADSKDISKIELLGNGTGLYWPTLDVAHLVSGLLAGVYGSAKWMERLELESGPRRISA
jgi:predicted TPR repeat methyltransferase